VAFEVTIGWHSTSGHTDGPLPQCAREGTEYLHLSHLADAFYPERLTVVSAYMFILVPCGNLTHNPGVASAMILPSEPAQC
jgi:hypothetical protein